MLSKDTLSAIIALSSIGNFKSTAATLGITPVKLTRLVQRAEDECGFSIFDRNRLTTTLTNRGAQLLEACKELDLAAADFEQKLALIKGKSHQSLRVCCGPLATHTVLLPILRGLLGEKPEISANLIVTAHGEPIQQLRNGELDLFIGDLTHTAAFDDIKVMVLEKREVLFAARPANPIHEGGPYSFAELLQRSLALPHIHRYWQTTFKAALKDAGLQDHPTTPKIECDDYQTLISLAATTDIITAGTFAQLEDALASGRLALIKLSSKIRYNICCAVRDPHANDLVEQAWQAIAANHAA